MQAKRNSSNLIVPQTQVRLLREELQLLQEPGSYVGEVVKAMGKNKVLVKVGINLAAALYSRLRLLGRIAALALALAYFISQQYCTGRCLRALMHVGPGNSHMMVPLLSFGAQVNPEGKYVVDLDKSIDVAEIKPNLRVALRNDSYVLHKV